MKKRVSLGLSLTLLASSAASAFAAEHHPVQHPKQIKNVEFQPMKAPTTIENMIKTYTEASVKVTYKDGSVEETPLNYNQLFLSKDKIVDNKGELIAAGTPIDANGDPIIDRSVPDKPSPYVSDAPDSNSFITINGKSYIISHYEYESVNNAGKEISGLPASMTLTQVDRDDKTGKLTVNHAKKIDFSNVDGLWTPCNGSTTDWGTHLGSEEYEPDARAFEDPSSSSYKDVTNFAKLYFGDTSKANPYYYGWIPEISVDESGNASVVKHYSTGRFSHEMMQVLPDNKTALFGDDGSNTMMFMYVADKEKDFSAGTLYAAKFKQTSTENGGKGDLQWIKLGHATDNEVKTIIDKETKFSDIFETADQPTKGFTAVKTAASKKVEYLKVKPGMEKAAAFLESRRYGAILGATSEFNKMEGLTVNKKDKKAYMAISYQNSAMLKESGAVQDDIQLPKLESGVTYQLNLGSHQKDQANGKINSRYVPASMEGLLIGQDLEKADAYGNTADPNKIANPDNLTYSNDLNTLFIGEDSSLHTNNFVWAYNVKTKKLSRILSVPVGAEATGLRAVENIKNSRYVLSNYQHPGEDISDKNITAVDKEELANAMKESIGIQETGGVGYISGLPSKDGAPYKKH
ncbi:alkaline phosphatase PhoX [Priestia megaterium]|uniref:PhoX family protein n=1 Tax=Priestia megaterium TaxID=1404 RepID=UPI000762B07B|nr:alkaline phosphatase PhoX [Priestia megaterium]KWU63386.1 alkaline phosphatase [Priestia megaterium]